MYTSELKLEIRYYETDLMGIVHHSNYVRFFECGRINLMKELGMPIEELESRGVMMPVSSVEIHYKLPSKMGETLRVVTTIKKWPLARLFNEQKIYNEKNELVCEGTVIVGFIDVKTRRPVRAPEFMLEKLAPHFSKEEQF